MLKISSKPLARLKYWYLCLDTQCIEWTDTGELETPTSSQCSSELWTRLILRAEDDRGSAILDDWSQHHDHCVAVSQLLQPSQHLVWSDLLHSPPLQHHQECVSNMKHFKQLWKNNLRHEISDYKFCLSLHVTGILLGMGAWALEYLALTASPPTPNIIPTLPGAPDHSLIFKQDTSILRQWSGIIILINRRNTFEQSYPFISSCNLLQFPECFQWANLVQKFSKQDPAGYTKVTIIVCLVINFLKLSPELRWAYTGKLGKGSFIIINRRLYVL